MNDSALRNPFYLLPLFCLLLLQSCAEEQPAVPQPSAEYVVMLDEQGAPEKYFD